MTKPNTAEDAEKLDHSYITDGHIKWKTVEQGFFFLISTQLPYDPIITFLGIYPIEIKIYLLTQKRGIQMFITALFITATNWKELRCSSFRG